MGIVLLSCDVNCIKLKLTDI